MRHTDGGVTAAAKCDAPDAPSMDPTAAAAELRLVVAAADRSDKLLCKAKNIARSEEKRDEEHARSARNRGEERRTLTLKIGYVYHVMNSSCIHLRAEGSNIYMYRRGRIYKEPPGEVQ
jgi:hypothetical protein